ncbi:MAG: GNAT family N-acetyltransferase [Salinarimonas sp.]
MISWFAATAPASVLPLSIKHTRELAALHAGAFARPWSAFDFERLLVERDVYGDGLFLGESRPPQGFCLSRVRRDEAEVLTIAIAPSLRGKGHARQLLHSHLETLRARRVIRVHLEVDEGNRPALALYARFGFTEIGRRAGGARLDDGERATAILMAADL